MGVLAAAAVMLSVIPGAAPAVAQDSCATALAIPCNGSGTLDPCSGDAGWIGGSCTTGDTPAAYGTFVAETASAQIRTDHSTIGTDSHYVIYQVDQANVCDTSAWVAVGCSEDECYEDPDACDNPYEIDVRWLGKISLCDLTVGDTYIVQLGGYAGCGGEFLLEVECPGKGTTCGDGVIDICTEECDGDDAGSCEYGCNPDCTCGRGKSVPMLPNWGLAGLGVLLLAGGAMVFGRRRTATA